jgi:hypothetical protein
MVIVATSTCLAEYDSRAGPMPSRQPNAGKSHPPLIEINCDISGKIKLVVMWSGLPEATEDWPRCSTASSRCPALRHQSC